MATIYLPRFTLAELLRIRATCEELLAKLPATDTTPEIEHDRRKYTRALKTNAALIERILAGTN